MAILVFFTQDFNCNSLKWGIGYAKLVGAGTRERSSDRIREARPTQSSAPTADASVGSRRGEAFVGLRLNKNRLSHRQGASDSWSSISSTGANPTRLRGTKPRKPGSNSARLRSVP